MAVFSHFPSLAAGHEVSTESNKADLSIILCYPGRPPSKYLFLHGLSKQCILYSSRLVPYHSSRVYQPMTVASIIISGHLRDACEDHTHLLAFKRACEQSYDVCNVFICTWTTVDVRSNISSSGCLHNISSALMPVGMLVDSQGTPSARKWVARGSVSRTSKT